MKKEKFLGIELGSTRIKSVLVDADSKVISQGSFQWENRLENGYWTYSLDEVEKGIQACFADLAQNYKNQFQEELSSVNAMGFSAMMHGYLAFDKNGNLLTPFRTWRNTTTEAAAEILTKEFNFNIPLRWSIAHLYQAILDNEAHVKDIAFITTLAGYVHWKLTGEKVLGIGDVSGMFPIDSKTNAYDKNMVELFDNLIKDKGYSWKLLDVLPKILVAGEDGGKLTESGAKYLDPKKVLKAGILVAPPEGDAGTGMVATNAIAVKTGNVSTGTSIFAMLVLEKALSAMHPEVDMVTTPAGKPVAMVHCNNCTSDINEWSDMLHQFSARLGVDVPITKIYELIYTCGLKGDMDCGGLLSYNYISGEPITGLNEGRPVFMRLPDAKFSFENFARTHLYSAIATLKIGMDILFTKESVKVEKLFGHGGFFKVKGVGQKLMADMLNIPISIMETAGEGGPWGMAVLAAYAYQNSADSLESFLEKRVFAHEKIDTINPDKSNNEKIQKFMDSYIASLDVEKTAVKTFNN